MKTVLIYSGGMDSTVLLYHLLADGRDVVCLGINYGQRHCRELEAAGKICALCGVEFQIADLRGIKHLLAGSSQTSDEIAVPHGHYAAENMKLTVVPNRNMVMLSIAGAWAISRKAESIAYAAHAGDHAIYPDCREEFVKPLAQALWNADWHPVSVDRPFIGMTKGQIAARGGELGVPFELTYSCYEGQETHCGFCGTCVERREAFEQAGIKDPTNYVHHH
jgi:7-cyano-7-deazaguanine synthase